MSLLKEAFAYVIYQESKEERPTMEDTYLRQGVSLIVEKVPELYNEMFPQGSFLRDYFWLFIPIFVVVAVSFASIFYRMFQELGSAIWRL
eukprot:4837423-Ditylum_brightwellii.AAC.1